MTNLLIKENFSDDEKRVLKRFSMNIKKFAEKLTKSESSQNYIVMCIIIFLMNDEEEKLEDYTNLLGKYADILDKTVEDFTELIELFTEGNNQEKIKYYTNLLIKYETLKYQCQILEILENEYEKK